MENTTITRRWIASVLSFGVATGMALGAPVLAVAQEAPADQNAQPVQAEPPVRASEVGHATIAWLDLQRSGAQAAPALPTLGSEAGLAYKRYMESFKSRIPDLYESKLGGSGGTGAPAGAGASN